MADFSPAPSIYGKSQVKELKRALFLEIFNLFIFIFQPMIAEDPVLPWYNDLEVLRFVFVKLERLTGFLKMPAMKPEFLISVRLFTFVRLITQIVSNLCMQ